MNVPDHGRVTGLSGNEIFCLSKLGMRPGQLCIGNSVIAIGVAKGIGAGLSTLGGGEVNEVTQLVHDGRLNAFKRMVEEAKHYGGIGLSGISFEMITHGGNLEFITTGSTVHKGELGDATSLDTLKFSTSADVQQLYCQMDSGFKPFSFVFGNVAYSIGVGGGIGGIFRSMVRGEVPQYTDIFSKTRHLALSRICQEAKRVGANAVIGIQTTIAPLLGTQEMLMVGTASHHDALNAYQNDPVTSDLTNEEMWNLVHLGFLPIKLVMGVSVYSLGFTGGILAGLRSLVGGEVGGLTELLYEAREKALARLQKDAEACGADEIVGVKVRVYDLGGGLVEFMAIGTAVKRFPGITTKTDALPPQAIIQDRETFVDSVMGVQDLGRTNAASATRLQLGPMQIMVFFLFLFFYAIRIFLHK